MLTIIALVVALLFVPSPWNVVLVACAAFVDVVETGVFVWWSRRRRSLGVPGVGAEAIVGRAGVTLQRLDPGGGRARGQVRVDGEIWGATATVPIEPGMPVIVLAIDGLVLEVEPSARS